MLIWPLFMTALIGVGAFALGGVGLVSAVALLAVFELSVSFDNAVVNATVLRRMPRFWQRAFLSVGILVAVFGMRLAVPLGCLSLATGLPPQQAVLLATADPRLMHAITEASAPVLMPFGAVYLLMVFFGFVFTERRTLWLRPLESALQRAGRIPNLAVLLVLVLIVAIAEMDAEHRMIILLSGLAGLAVYLLVNGAAQFFLHPGEDTADDPGDTGEGVLRAGAGRSAVFLFLYLELLDASFSFDGVIGAFALSRNVLVIAAGLGVGALFVRSFTVQLVRRGVIAEYVYLEHGAHWAIGALAVTMLLRLHHTVTLNSTATGLIGVGLIGAAFLASLRARRYVPAHARRSRAFRLRDRRARPARVGRESQPSGDDLIPWSLDAAMENRPRPVRRGLLSTLTVVVLTAASVPAFALLVRSAAPEIELRIPGRLQATPVPMNLPSPTAQVSQTPSGDDSLSLPTPAARPAKAHRRHALKPATP